MKFNKKIIVATLATGLTVNGAFSSDKFPQIFTTKFPNSCENGNIILDYKVKQVQVENEKQIAYLKDIYNSAKKFKDKTLQKKVLIEVKKIIRKHPKFDGSFEVCINNKQLKGVVL